MTWAASIALASTSDADSWRPRFILTVPSRHPDVVTRDDAIRGDHAAIRTLVGRLVPIIQARVARCLACHGRPEARRNVREEVADLTQEVLASLFAHGGRVLAAWSPEKGLSLNNFVGLVAQREALSLLRTRRHSPWTEEPTEDMGPLLPVISGPEERLASRQALGAVLAWLEAHLSPLGLELFELLIIQDLDAAEVVERTGLSRDAVYAWRSRLEKLIRQRVAALEDGDGAPRAPKGVAP